MERIGDLLLEHAAPSGPARRFPLLLIHGMWGGSWYLRNYLYLGEGWEQPFGEILAWLDRVAPGR